MKKLFFLIAIYFAGLSVSAQGSWLQVKSTGNKLITYAKVRAFETTDSTLSVRDTLVIKNNSAGFVTVTVIGADSLGNGITGKVIYRYKKAAGTITLASGENISAAVTDTGLGTGTWTFTTTADNNLQLKTKGKLGYTVRWQTKLEHEYPGSR